MVKQGLDRDLDRMKDRYDGLNSLLKHVAIDIATTIPEELDIDVNVIYFPQLGFNIAIPLRDRGQAAYSGPAGDWELVFVTETRAYFKDFRMRELDVKLGDIYGLICGKHPIASRRPLVLRSLFLEKEIEIVYDLAQRVLQYEDVLVEASDICGEMDRFATWNNFLGAGYLTISRSLLALTQAASFYKLTRPRMVSENVIRIRGGR